MGAPLPGECYFSRRRSRASRHAGGMDSRPVRNRVEDTWVKASSSVWRWTRLTR